MTTSLHTAKELAEIRFSEYEAQLQSLSRWMYENPELAFEEVQTSARMADLLATAGFTVTAPAYGLATAFEATVGTSGPRVVICAEMDALPDVGHACGHNIIATAGLGAGIALVPVAEALGIRVTVLGTPAEEHFGGKINLIDAGAFNDVAAAMMIHPSPIDVVDPTFLAVDHLDVEFIGKAAHASSAPELGLNALDAAVQAYMSVAALRQHVLDSDRIHGIITHGGSAPNVVPDYTAMSWNVRSATDARLDVLVKRVIDCFKGAALATGCTVNITTVGQRYKDLRTDKLLASLYVKNSNLAGRPMPYFSEITVQASGSTDMGNVSHEVPSIHPMLGLDCDPAVNHQREFAAATLTDKGMATIREGALAMAWTAIDLAEQDLWDELGST